MEFDRGGPDSLAVVKTYLDALSADQLRCLTWCTWSGLPGLHYIATLPSKSGDRILLEQIIKLFKNAGCDINESTDAYLVETPRPSSGFTPLLVAIQESNLPFLESLLEHGARVDFYDRKGFYPIHWAIFKGDMACFKKLVQVGGLQVADEFDERFKSPEIHPVFHTAIDEGRTEMVAHLLEKELARPEQLAVYHGLLPEKPDYQDGFRISYKSRRNSFLRENFGMALFLTIPPEESFANVVESDNPLRNLIVPFSPLTRAVRKRRIPIIEVLLQYGAKVSSYDDLHYCILRGDVEIACMLVDQLSAQGLANDEMFEKVGPHYLHPVAFETKELEDYTVKLVDLYVKAGWDLNSLSRCPTRIQGFKSYEVSISSELSLLHLACNSGCHKLIKYLVERGANVNSPTIGNALLYPLQLSIFLQDWEAVEYLISNGADGNAVGGFLNSHLSKPYSSVKDLEYQFTSKELMLLLGEERSFPMLQEMMKNGIPGKEAMIFAKVIYAKNLEMITGMVHELCSVQNMKMQDLMWVPVNENGCGVSVPCLHWILLNAWDVCMKNRRAVLKLISLMGSLGYDFNLVAGPGADWENNTFFRETSTLEDPLIFIILRMEKNYTNNQPGDTEFPLLATLLGFDHVNLNVRNSSGMNPVEFAINLWDSPNFYDRFKMDVVVQSLVRHGVDVSQMELKGFEYSQGSMKMIQLLCSAGAKIQPNLFALREGYGWRSRSESRNPVVEDIKKLNHWKDKFDKEDKLTLKHLCVMQVRKTLRTIGDMRALDAALLRKDEVEGKILEFE